MKRMDATPTAKVAVKKNVLKKYQVKNENVYFLKKDTEFEIELFNPTNKTILANIKLNGDSSNINGIVLYPGQRIFLERHLETNKKLKFNSYIIDGSEESKEATKDNGLVEVSFHLERISPTITLTTNIQPNYWDMNPPIIYGDIPEFPCNYFCSTDTTSSKSFSNSVEVTTNTIAGDIVTGVETGLVGKGSKSDQAFINTNEEFEDYYFINTKFRILPDSQKIKTIEDLKHKRYCPECGKKVAHKHKYCSACGNKLE